MSLTIKQLREYFNSCPDDMIIQNQFGDDIVHYVNSVTEDKQNLLVLSSQLPIGDCNICGNRAYNSDIEDYQAICPTCQINLYEFEITRIDIKQ